MVAQQKKIYSNFYAVFHYCVYCSTSLIECMEIALCQLVYQPRPKSAKKEYPFTLDLYSTLLQWFTLNVLINIGVRIFNADYNFI